MFDPKHVQNDFFCQYGGSILILIQINVLVICFFPNLTDMKLLNNKCQGGDKDFFKFKVGSGQVIYYFRQYCSLFSYHTTNHFW